MSFSIKTIGHWVAVAARDIVKFGQIAQNNPIVQIAESTLATFVPGSAIIERAANGALGKAVEAAMGVVGVADGTTTISIQFVKDEIDELKAIGTYLHSLAPKAGVTLPQLPTAASPAKAAPAVLQAPAPQPAH